MISIITPVYSDKANLSVLAARVHKVLESYQYELIIVDYSSSGGMAEVTKGLSEQYPTKVIHHKGEKDSASAVMAGLNQASGEIIGIMDASLQHPSEKLPELLQVIEDGADIAVASRYIPGGGIEGGSITERIVSRGAAMITRLVLPSIRQVKDPVSGFFLLRRKVIEDIGLKPGSKILLQALASRADKVSEVPYIEERTGQKDVSSHKNQLGYIKNIFLMATKEKELRRFIQFCLVGLSGVVVNMGTFWLLTRVAGLYDLIALIIGLLASIISNFVLNEVWTFSDRRTGSVKAISMRVLKFDLVSVGAIALYYGIYTPLTRFWLGEDSFLALAIAIGVGLIWNFSANTLWTWRKSETEFFTNP